MTGRSRSTTFSRVPAWARKSGGRLGNARLAPCAGERTTASEEEDRSQCDRADLRHLLAAVLDVLAHELAREGDVLVEGVIDAERGTGRLAVAAAAQDRLLVLVLAIRDADLGRAELV